MRHLLNCEPLTKGRHELKWDGLTTPNWRQPGDPVAPGTYQASAIYHTGIGLRLKGWADNSGETPWDFPAQTRQLGRRSRHARRRRRPTRTQVYLGWSGAEAGKALLACDLSGKPVWNHTRGGIGGARAVAVDGGTVYVARQRRRSIASTAKPANTPVGKDATRPSCRWPICWKISRSRPTIVSRWPAGRASCISAPKLANQIVVIDAATGAVQQRIGVTKPLAVSLAPDGQLYVVARGQ